MIRIIRPELPASAGMCVVIGQTIALGGFPPPPRLGLGFALGFLLSASAMVFNDYFDLEVDRVNAPERPLPSGQLTLAEALGLGAALGLAALIAAWAVSPLAFGVCLAGWILGFLYNWKFKAAGLAGNLMVSASVAMTFLVGGISVRRTASPLLWIFALIAFCFDLAEEIAGDAMDMEGDRVRSSRSLALVCGRPTALRISAALFASVILLTGVPPLLGLSGPGYWIPIALMDGLIVFFLRRLLRSASRAEGHRAMRALYLSASLGLLAFLLGAFLK